MQALYHLTKTLDPTRPVVGNDGWESVATDIIGIHDYDPDPERLAQRYRRRRLAAALPAGAAGRPPAACSRDRPDHPDRADGVRRDRVLAGRGSTWGYSRGRQREDASPTRYCKLLEAVRSIPLFAGFCYTQFADTYQEANGLLYADRTPKIPLDVIAEATRGVPGARRERGRRPGQPPVRGRHGGAPQRSAPQARRGRAVRMKAACTAAT